MKINYDPNWKYKLLEMVIFQRKNERVIEIFYAVINDYEIVRLLLITDSGLNGYLDGE